MDVNHIVDGQRSLTCHLRTVVVLLWARLCGDVFFPSSPGLIDLLDTLSGYQHPLKLLRVRVQFIILLQVPFQSTLGSLSLFGEVCFAAEGNEEEKQRVVVVVLPLLFLGCVAGPLRLYLYIHTLLYCPHITSPTSPVIPAVYISQGIRPLKIILCVLSGAETLSPQREYCALHWHSGQDL